MKEWVLRPLGCGATSSTHTRLKQKPAARAPTCATCAAGQVQAEHGGVAHDVQQLGLDVDAHVVAHPAQQ